MNFHPLIIHFPIAFLTVYAILEFIRIKKIQDLPYWFYVKAALVVIGSASTIPALFSGKLIEHGFQDRRHLVNVHSFWAELTTVIFGIIALSYFIEIVARNNLFGIKLGKSLDSIWQIKQKFSKIVLETKLVLLLALLGLVAVIITGALGGIIVYGPSLDPFTQFIYNIFII